MKVNPLIKLGNIPVPTGTIAACFDHLSAPNEKIRALEKDGQLIRLKRGLYIVSSEVSGKPVNACLCANHIYGPSYVSLQWALRWSGLTLTFLRSRLRDCGSIWRTISASMWPNCPHLMSASLRHVPNLDGRKTF